MRGTLLPTLRSMLRAEIGETSSTSIATQKDASVNTLFSNAQKLYSTLRDWPFLERKWDVAVPQAGRYVAFSTVDIRGTTATLNTERPFSVSVLFNRLYIPLDYGIGDEEFTHRNSDRGEKQDPIQRWDYSTNSTETANADQFEVWPMPVTAQTVRFMGQRQPYALSAETDKADLDDMLLVFSVGAQLLARLDDRTAEAQLMSSKAASRLNFLTGAYPNRTEKLILGRNTCPRPGRRDIKLVAIAGS
jgi:hypothetical protein